MTQAAFIRISRAMILVSSISFISVGCRNDSGIGKWAKFVPPESSHIEHRISESHIETPSKRTGIRISSLSVDGRFALTPVSGAISVTEGERLKLGAWFIPEADFEINRNSPGFVLRATLFTEDGRNFGQGHYYIGTRGIALGPPEQLAVSSLASEWTKLEAVLAVPSGVHQVKLHVFLWKARGSVTVDNVYMERVSPSTKLSPLVGGSEDNTMLPAELHDAVNYQSPKGTL